MNDPNSRANAWIFRRTRHTVPGANPAAKAFVTPVQTETIGRAVPQNSWPAVPESD
jgi:hypothetical protein